MFEISTGDECVDGDLILLRGECCGDGVRTYGGSGEVICCAGMHLVYPRWEVVVRSRLRVGWVSGGGGGVLKGDGKGIWKWVWCGDGGDCA